MGLGFGVGSGYGFRRDGCGLIVVVFFVRGRLLGEEVKLVVDIICGVEGMICPVS